MELVTLSELLVTVSSVSWWCLGEIQGKAQCPQKGSCWNTVCGVKFQH